MKNRNNKKTTLYIMICGILSLAIIITLVFFNFQLKSNPNTLISKTDETSMNLKPIPTIELSPEPNEKIGKLTFPKVGMEVPIVYGYNASYMDQYFDEVGLEAWGNFPGQENKLYINGHRHLAFQNLKHMELGDTIIIYMYYGEFTYQVSKEPQVVLANDKEAVDFYYKDHDTIFSPQILRLQTCYPFEAGSTLDHRYLVDLVLIESNYN